MILWHEPDLAETYRTISQKLKRLLRKEEIRHLAHLRNRCTRCRPDGFRDIAGRVKRRI